MVNAAIDIVGVLCAANLLLTFMVIRWARQQFREFASRRPIAIAGRLVGSKAPQFEVRTIAGTAVTLADLTGARSAVAFLSVNCGPCRAQLPEFVEYARTVPGGASQVLAVVGGDSEHDQAAIDEFVAELEGVASVVVEPARTGAASKAFSVMGWPTFYAIDESGQIEAGGAAVRMLSTAQRQLA